MSAGLLVRRKYNICGWFICGEWKIADVVIKEAGENSFYSYMLLPETLWKYLAEIDEESNKIMDRASWRELAKCNQEEFEKSGTNGKCIEAKELMVALLESFINYDHDYLLKRMADEFKKQYDVECFAVLHHNKRKINLYIHMIFAERKRLEALCLCI